MIQQGPMELSAEQQFLIRQVIEKKKSVFFTGSAGTGKSVLLRHLIEELKMHYLSGNVAVTASTGIAACNIGGCTLHSFAGVGLGKGSVDQLVEKILSKKQARARWRKAKVLIIDEIPDAILPSTLEQQKKQQNEGSTAPPMPSITTGRTTTIIKAEDLANMENEDEFDYLPEMDVPAGPLAHENIHSPDDSINTTSSSSPSSPSSPTSFSEDPFAPSAQVPPSELVLPVVEPEDPKLCFESRAWKECIDYTLQLTEVFRQRDPLFIKMLTEMRHGQLSEETCQIFRTLRRVPSYADDGIRPTELYALRRQVEAANHRYLAELPGSLYIYEPQDSGPMASLMNKHSIAPSVLQLKKDAQVMLIKNLSSTLVNGSMGIVVGFQRDVTYADNGALVESHFPIVRFPREDMDYVVRPEEWKMEMPNGQVIASRIQTMERVKVDMGNIFEAGQAYVALSRATTLAGLQVLNFDRRSVQADERVAEFYRGLETVRELMDREAAQAEERMKRAAARKKRRKRAKTTEAAVIEEAAPPAQAPTTATAADEQSPTMAPNRPINAPSALDAPAVFPSNGGLSQPLVFQAAGAVQEGSGAGPGFKDGLGTQWLELEKKKWLDEAKKQWLQEMEEQNRRAKEEQGPIMDAADATRVVTSSVATETEAERKTVEVVEKNEKKPTRRAVEDLWTNANVAAAAVAAAAFDNTSSREVIPVVPAVPASLPSSALPTQKSVAPASKFKPTNRAPTTTSTQAPKPRADSSQPTVASKNMKPRPVEEVVERSWQKSIVIIKAKDNKTRQS
ncbi:hypothetical protein DFQ26_000009 [Actinomortierella ambigua]|nr:hypothetical protein DFQ26_000009 [Actinomortierella ambigua]